jgi:hypothetical protein
VNQKQAKQPRPNRTRAHAIQLYLSDWEHAQLAKITRQQQCSVAELIRAWIASTAVGGGAQRQSRSDPRQLTIE